MADGDIFTSLHLTASVDGAANLTVQQAHQKIVADPITANNSLGGVHSDIFSTLISDNFVSQSDFTRTIDDNSLSNTYGYANQSLVYANTDISNLDMDSNALELPGTSFTNPLGSDNSSNSNKLLPFINKKPDTSISCIADNYVPDTKYQVTDYTLFQSVIQNTIFEGFGAYSTTQGFQQNLVNLLLTDDSQLYGGYNFGTSSHLPLIMFDVTRQFLNTKLQFRHKADRIGQHSAAVGKDSTADPVHTDVNGNDYAADTVWDGAHAAATLRRAMKNKEILKLYKSVVWHEYRVAYETKHAAENLTADGLKGKDAHHAKGDNDCRIYIEKIQEEHSDADFHGANDHIEITMEEVRRELFKTLCCPELFGQIFYDHHGVDVRNGPQGALFDETQFEYDQNDVNTWKGGQIRISNINEARLWLLQYRNWLIHQLKAHNVYNRIRNSTHPLLRQIDNIENFFYNLDSFTIALITGGASLPDLYANVLDVHQKVQFKTDDNLVDGPLVNCGLLSNNDFLRWAYISSRAKAVTNGNNAHNSTNWSEDGVGALTDSHISGIYYEQQTLGYGQQVGAGSLFGLSVTDPTQPMASQPNVNTEQGKEAIRRFQYRNSDADALSVATALGTTGISGVNYNPINTTFDNGSDIDTYTYEPNLRNEWWNDEVCAGISREWVLPNNAREVVGAVHKNKYYIDKGTTELCVSTSVTSSIDVDGVDTVVTAVGRGNPGFLTNDVFNVSNWAWHKYQPNGSHKAEIEHDHLDIRPIDDFVVDSTVSGRSESLRLDNSGTKQGHQDTIYPKLEDPRKVTRTFCHNAFGSSIKILDPLRQLYDACSSGHTWLTTPGGSVVRYDGNSEPITLHRRLGYGFCLGDLISVGQSHHFNIGSRITTHGRKRRASVRKNGKTTQLPVEFNAVVNCEFAIMFNVVDRCTDIVKTKWYDEGQVDEMGDTMTALVNAQVIPEHQSIYYALSNVIDNEDQATVIDFNSYDHDGWVDVRGDLFNDIYNLSLLYLARNETATLEAITIATTNGIESFNGDTDVTKDGGGAGESLYKHGGHEAKPSIRYILNMNGGVLDDSNTNYSRHGAQGAGTATRVRGTNLLYCDGNKQLHPSSEDPVNKVAFYEGAANTPIPVDKTKDMLNLWWDYVPTSTKTLLLNDTNTVNSAYGDFYMNHKGAAVAETITPNPDNLVKCTMLIPVWNTAALRNASELDDTIIRGNATLPIDPDLQSGTMIGIDQYVTTERDVGEQINFVSQPNPLLFSDESGTSGLAVTQRILPEATLNQGTVDSDDPDVVPDTAPPETGNLDSNVPNLVLAAAAAGGGN